MNNFTPYQLEQKLKALEKKYDKSSAPTRTYYTDMQDIGLLVQAKKIDEEHAEILLANAKKAYEEAEARRKEALKPKPVGVDTPKALKASVRASKRRPANTLPLLAVPHVLLKAFGNVVMALFLIGVVLSLLSH
jgi:hypothetical protein